MDCEDFEEHIDDYFSDPNFDWKMRQEIDKHYFSCDKCYKTYQAAKLMADKDLKKETIKELVKNQIDEAMALNKAGKYGKAIKAFEAVLKLDPENKLAKAVLASLYRVTGTPIAEIPADYIEATVEPLVKTAEKEFAENQNFEKATELYTEALLWKPDDVEIKKMLGFMKFRSGRFDEVVEILEDVKEILKSDHSVFTVLGDTYRELKDHQMALIAYEKAYELSHEPFVLSHIGLQHIKLGDLEKGRETVEKAYSLNRNDILIWNAKAILHMTDGEFSKAATLLEKCVTLEEFGKQIKNISTTYSNLAMAYYEIGKIDNAKQYIKAAKKLDPEHEIIQRNFEIITGKSEGNLLLLI